jgi:hypothetical protein
MRPALKVRSPSEPAQTFLPSTEITTFIPASEERVRELARRTEENSKTLQELHDFKVTIEATEKEKGKWENRFYTVLGLALLVIGVLVGIIVAPHL